MMTFSRFRTQEWPIFRYRQGMASSLELTTLGHRIRHHRLARGYTLDELGALVGVAGSQLSLIENGKRELKLGELQRLARILGVTLDELLSPEPPSKQRSKRSATLRSNCTTKGTRGLRSAMLWDSAPRALALVTPRSSSMECVSGYPSKRRSPE